MQSCVEPWNNTGESTPKRSTYRHISEIVPPFEVISVRIFFHVKQFAKHIDWCEFPRRKCHLKLPQQVALTNSSTQASAIVRVLIVTKLWSLFYLHHHFAYVKRAIFSSVTKSTRYLATILRHHLSSYHTEKHLFMHFSNQCFCLRKLYKSTI